MSSCRLYPIVKNDGLFDFPRSIGWWGNLMNETQIGLTVGSYTVWLNGGKKYFYQYSSIILALSGFSYILLSGWWWGCIIFT